jgi:CPA1 family monovalent cation:H+ antiporter|tara:strand:+ start:440 stop:2248 length:1809 start_codon:yes stop_codon:yes gene_type:complete
MSAIPPDWLAGILGTLILSLLVALALRWIRLPYTIALVIVGLIMGWIGPSFLPGIVPGGGLMSAELILFILLPPLLFEGAAGMHIDQLKNNSVPIALLAIPGVILNTIIIGLIIWRLVWYGEENGILYGLLIGSILAATDPVSVLALVRTLGAPKRLSVLLEGESLFNDGTAIVIFNIVLVSTLTIIGGEELTTSEVLTESIAKFLTVVIIGTLVGAVLGSVSNWLLENTEDHLVEIALTVALTFGSFLMAELFHGSGVIAVVVAGLLVGNHGIEQGMTPTARIGLHHFWEVVVFLINSMLFLMIGYELQTILVPSTETLVLAFIGIMAASVARLVLFPLTALSNISKQQPISKEWQVAMYWGGLRGSIPIALLLLLSHIVHEGTHLEGINGLIYLSGPAFEKMLIIGFSVVLWTLIFQGLTMKPLLRKLGITGVISESEQEYEIALAEVIGSKAALLRLNELADDGMISQKDKENLSESYLRQEFAAQQRVTLLSRSSIVHAARVESARREMLLSQIEALREEGRRGTLSTHVSSRILKGLNEALSESLHERESIEIASMKTLTEDMQDSSDIEFTDLLPKATEQVTGVSMKSLELNQGEE